MNDLLILLAFLIVLAMCPRVDAQECPDISRYKEAREIVQDLERIVTPSGIQESYKTEIGGIDQWLNVRGQDKANPIILFIHGGPASPLTPGIWQFQRPIEEYFTVVNWDQRGAGKTYNEADPDSISDSIHISRYVDDAIEVAEHVSNRYHKNRIILMGHSWGTIIGMNAALERPDLLTMPSSKRKLMKTPLQSRNSSLSPRIRAKPPLRANGSTRRESGRNFMAG